LRRAATLSLERLDEGAQASALAAAEAAAERLDRGVDHTIVALSGGTGSGKSSLFNAISEMAFSETGAVRPTTFKTVACVWGTGAEKLLAWLGVERDSWIKRDSVLESHIGELRGLILLDLPDFDSAWQANQLIAERALPLADVLIWVTDPQKYADPALHERFGAAAKAHPGRLSLVVLNQIDTVDQVSAERIGQALTELLVEDGLTDPVVALSSAKTGQGVDAIRQLLIERTAHRTMACQRTAADLIMAATELAGESELSGLGKPPAADPEWLTAAHERAVTALTLAAIGRQGVREPVQPDLGVARQVLAEWAATASGELPGPWAMAVGHAVASARNIVGRLEEGLAAVELPARPGFWARFGRRAKVESRRRVALEESVHQVLGPLAERTLTAPTRHVLDDRQELAGLLAKAASLARAAAGGSNEPAD
jgi:GTPase Era involved in 16S rRNA processing